jgi:hypothetical protein
MNMNPDMQAALAAAQEQGVKQLENSAPVQSEGPGGKMANVLQEAKAQTEEVVR